MSYYENKQDIENQFKNWGDIVKREFPVGQNKTINTFIK